MLKNQKQLVCHAWEKFYITIVGKERENEEYIGDLDIIIGSCYATSESFYNGVYQYTGNVFNNEKVFFSASGKN